MAVEKSVPVVPKKAQDLGYLDLPNNPPAIEWARPEWAESPQDKFKRKVGENPFVPIGLGVTVCALSYGLWQMKTGDKVKSQKMMRVRVAAQAFTVFALLAGVAYSSVTGKKT